MTVRTAKKERTYTVNPLLTSIALGFGFLAVAGVIASSAYLFLRDDITRSSLMRQAKMQHLYEDRISNLINVACIPVLVRIRVRHPNRGSGLSIVATVNSVYEPTRGQGTPDWVNV